MELRILNYFLMVAREENITKAANLLHITQPTLSRQLMQLEEELGVKLFERNRRNIVLTEEGMLLRRRAQELVSLANKTKQEFLKEDSGLSGEIAIGSGEILGMNSLAEIISSFREKYPLIRFELYSGNADEIKTKIEEGTLDMGLLLEPVHISKYDFIRMPKKEEWGVMVRKDSPLGKKEYITSEDLINIPIIAAKRELVQNELSNWFGDYLDSIDIVSTYNLIYNSVIMVEKGVGALLCLKLEANYENLCFIPLSPKLELGSVLVWKKNKIFSPTVNEFIKYANKCLKDIKNH